MTLVEHRPETEVPQPTAEEVFVPPEIDDPYAGPLLDLLEDYQRHLPDVGEPFIAAPMKGDPVIDHIYWYFDPGPNRQAAWDNYQIRLGGTELRARAQAFNNLAMERNAYHWEQYLFFMWEWDLAGKPANSEPYPISAIGLIRERVPMKVPTIEIEGAAYNMTSLSLGRNQDGEDEIALIRLQNQKDSTERDGKLFLIIPLEKSSIELMQAGRWEEFAYRGHPHVPIGAVYPERDYDLEHLDGSYAYQRLNQVASDNPEASSTLAVSDANGLRILTLDQQPMLFSAFLSRHGS